MIILFNGAYMHHSGPNGLIYNCNNQNTLRINQINKFFSRYFTQNIHTKACLLSVTYKEQTSMKYEAQQHTHDIPLTVISSHNLTHWPLADAAIVLKV